MFSHSSRILKLKTRVFTGWVSDETSLPNLQTSPSYCVLMWPLLCAHVLMVSLLLFIRALHLTLITSLNTNLQTQSHWELALKHLNFEGTQLNP